MTECPASRMSSFESLDQFLKDLLTEDGSVPFTVRGVSMSPGLKDGDRIQLRRRRFYLPGDIIIFRSLDNRYIVHRVLGYRMRRRRLEVVTKGDFSLTSDVPVALSRIVGNMDCPVEIATRLRAVGSYFQLALARLVARHVRRPGTKEAPGKHRPVEGKSTG